MEVPTSYFVDIRKVDDWPRSFSTSMVPSDGIHRGISNTWRDVMAEFLVVDILGAYNTIVGRPFMRDVQGVVSTYHFTMLYCIQSGYISKNKVKSGDSQIVLLNGFEVAGTKDSY